MGVRVRDLQARTRHSPEDNMKIDQEKRFEYTMDSVESYGVKISSRYNKIDELCLMLHVIDNTAEPLRWQIESMWVDSKCGAMYDVSVKCDTSIERAQAIADALASAFVMLANGYNGIYLRNGSLEIYKDAGWVEPTYHKNSRV